MSSVYLLAVVLLRYNDGTDMPEELIHRGRGGCSSSILQTKEGDENIEKENLLKLFGR